MKKMPSKGKTLVLYIIVLSVMIILLRYTGWLIGLGLFGWAMYILYHRFKLKNSTYKLWKPITSAIGGLLIFLLWLGIISSNPTSYEVTQNKSASTPTLQAPTTAQQPQQAPPNNTEAQQSIKQTFIMAHVIKVVDGDTMEVSYNGKMDTIRLLLIDTPETHDPNTPVEPFGPEASKFAEQTLMNKDVRLELDGPKRDKYNRLLCYLWIGDQLFNKMQIDKGFARVAYVYNPPYKYYDELLTAEQKAKEAKNGIWSIPNYVTNDGYNVEIANDWLKNQQKSQETANNQQAQTNQQQNQQPQSIQQQAQTQQIVYYKNCSEVRAAGKAPLHRGDPGYRSALDRDNDGIACE